MKKFYEKIITQIELDWATKRGKSFPLSPGDWIQWQREMLIQQRFWEIQGIFVKGKKTSKSDKPENVTPKLWQLWTSDDVRDVKWFSLMSEAEMNKAVTAIKDTVYHPMSSYIYGTTILSLADKFQCYEVVHNEVQFGRAAITVSPRIGMPKDLVFIGADEPLEATFYTGYFYVQDEEDKDVWESEPIPGFLVFKDKDMKEHAVGLPEFVALIEIEEDRNYLFTFYSQAENKLFIKRLESLESVDLFSDSGN